MSKSTNSKPSSESNIGKIIVGFILLASLATNGYLFWLYQQKQDELTNANQTIDLFKSDPNSAQQATVQEYVDAVGRIYNLPDDETPTTATVQDKELLADQPFFERAENGDVALIYPEAELAVLYRPSTGQLINVSSLTIDDQPEGLETQDDNASSSSGPASTTESE
ncbi:hypothetical protein BH23PAT2_BH23PAT2_05780 [soil metagenome]